MAVELYYSLRPADVRRSSRRRRVVVVTAKGSALHALAGALVGAVVGVVLAPVAGALFGLVIGAATGLTVGVPAAATTAFATRRSAGVGRARVIGALAAAGWGAALFAVLLAVVGRTGGDVGTANGFALSAVVVAMLATIGASVGPVAVAGHDDVPMPLDRFGPMAVAAERIRPIRAFETAPRD